MLAGVAQTGRRRTLPTLIATTTPAATMGVDRAHRSQDRRHRGPDQQTDAP